MIICIVDEYLLASNITLFIYEKDINLWMSTNQKVIWSSNSGEEVEGGGERKLNATGRLDVEYC